MNEAYAQGFIQKCAEAGVDPEQLVKTAVRGDQTMRVVRGLMRMHGERVVNGVHPYEALRRAVIGSRGPLSSNEDAIALLNSLLAAKVERGGSAATGTAALLRELLGRKPGGSPMSYGSWSSPEPAVSISRKLRRSPRAQRQYEAAEKARRAAEEQGGYW